uniref:Retrovirus-related Pol polyprotein from transposon TNT 1-94 n=1 Tax=Tanacetum cinerariifolium TaxID=118510 RepID=A0A6L2NB79_TANCI|nr:retrovirus-related Pol polyprotein from transposon TNT 1-94 [Tanacetum cinerariifolium]
MVVSSSLTDDELTEKELKQIEADDQAIQTILLGLPEDIYSAVDSCETAQEIWLRVHQMMKGSDIGIQEKKAKLFNEWERFTSNDRESIESYYHHFLKLINDLKQNKHFSEKIANITDPTTAMNMALALMAKAFKLNYSTPTNNNQRISSNPCNRRIAQPGINMGQDRQMQMVGGNGENQFRQYAGQNVGNLNGYNVVQNVKNQVAQNVIQNSRVQNVGNQNRLIGVPGNDNLNGNGNLIAARAEGNAAGYNGNLIRCYNCRGVGHFARNYTVRPRRRDATYLQTQLLIAQKEEARIQLQAEEFDLMAAAADLDKIEIVNANCILMANQQRASTSGTQTDKAPVYDSDGSAKVHNYEDCYDNDIFNMFTQEEQYTELLEPIPESHQVPQNDNNVISKEASKFVGDFKSVAKEVDESLTKHKALELEIERLLRAVVNQDIMSVVQNTSVAKFVGDFKSLAKEADESLAKHKVLELEIERLLREVVSQDIMSVVQKASVLIHQISKLSLNCEECKFDKILYDKAYNDMQQKIERLQARLGDLKGKSKDTSCVSDTLNPLSQKLENKNVELEFQVLNYAKENTHLKTTYKNLFDSISLIRIQTKTIIASLQNELQNTIYENAKLRAHLFNKVSVQKDNKRGMSTNTKFAKQSILGKPPKLGETHALSKPVTSNLIPTPQESKVMKNDKVIAPGMFRINPFKISREEKHVPNPVRASARTKSITISQPPFFTKKDVNSYSNGLSFTGIDNTKTRRPQPRSNTKMIGSPLRNLCLWCVDSGYSKHMTRNLKLLINFVWKVLGTIRFRNDHVAAILGFEVAFRRNACFIRNIDRVDFLKGDRSKNLYTINLHEMASASPICLMACTSSTKSWLWHQRLSHLNFDTINDLAKNDLVSGLPKFKYHKEHLCPSCEQRKSKRASHPPKPVPNSRQRLHFLHMDLCGPMRIASINEKRYILVIVDYYSRYTWVHFLESKDEAPDVIKTYLKRISILFQSPVIIIRTDNGTEFKNQVLKEYFDSVGISHQVSYVRTPQQNGVVERRNRTLVEAARTMLIFSHAPLFLWAEAIATACFTQNRSIIHRRFKKTPYELIKGRKLNISFLHVFGALYYPKNDREDIEKLGGKGDIGFFIGYSADSCAYKVYNRRTKKIIETMNVSFDELSAMAFEQRSSKPEL